MQIVLLQSCLLKLTLKYVGLIFMVLSFHLTHITCRPVQENLRWNCDRKKADEIANFNRHYAEHSGYYGKTNFKKEARAAKGPIEFYDSNTGKLLYTAPVGRTMDEFIVESDAHGWPSFRDAEVRWMPSSHYICELG
jgi:hypothetical protein